MFTVPSTSSTSTFFFVPHSLTNAHQSENNRYMSVLLTGCSSGGDSKYSVYPSPQPLPGRISLHFRHGCMVPPSPPPPVITDRSRWSSRGTSTENWLYLEGSVCLFIYILMSFQLETSVVSTFLSTYQTLTTMHHHCIPNRRRAYLWKILNQAIKVRALYLVEIRIQLRMDRRLQCNWHRVLKIYNHM